MADDKREDAMDIVKGAEAETVEESVVGKGLWKLLLVVLFFIGVVILFATVLQDELNSVIDYFRDGGALGGFLYSLLFLLIVVGFPSTALEVGAAIVFDSGYVAFFVSTTGKNIACWVGFFSARKCCKSWVESHILASEKIIIRAFNRAFVENPIKIAFLWSAAYVPIWSTFCGLASLDCSFKLFAAATFFPGLPYSILWVFVGRATRAALDAATDTGEEVDTYQVIGLTVGIILLIGGIGTISYFVRKNFKLIVAEQEALEAQQQNQTQSA